MTLELRTAWLAGLVDGEGSVGAHRTARGQITGSIQMSNTCQRTMVQARAVILELGITAVSHHHQERDPTRHQDAYYWRVSRVADLVRLCRALIPYSVTKRPQLELLLALAESRVDGQALDTGGRIASRSRKPYSDHEKALQRQLAALNLRGPAAIHRGH